MTKERIHSVEVEASGPFFFQVDEALVDDLLTADLCALRVYLVLRKATSLRRSGWFFAHGYDDLAAEARVSVRSAKRAVSWLWSKGLIEVERRVDKGGQRSHRFRVPTVGHGTVPECCARCGSVWHDSDSCPSASARIDPRQVPMFGDATDGTAGRATDDTAEAEPEVKRQEVNPSPVAPALDDTATDSPAPDGAGSGTAAPAGPSDRLSGWVEPAAPSAPPPAEVARGSALAPETAATGPHSAPGGSKVPRVPEGGSTTRSGSSGAQRDRGARRGAAPAAELVEVVRAWLSGLAVESIRDLAARRPTRGDVDAFVLVMKRSLPADASARKREIGRAIAHVLEHDAGDLVAAAEAAAGDQAARRAAQLAELEAEAEAAAEYERAEARRARRERDAVAAQAGADPVAVDLVDEALRAYCRENGMKPPTWLDVAVKLKPTFAGDVDDDPSTYGVILIATEPSRQVLDALEAAGSIVRKRAA